MAELTSMRNIGGEMAKKLRSIGIDSSEKLIAAGSTQAFCKLRQTYPQVCLVHLYTLEGAIRNIPFQQLPAHIKQELKAFSDSLNA